MNKIFVSLAPWILGIWLALVTISLVKLNKVVYNINKTVENNISDIEDIYSGIDTLFSILNKQKYVNKQLADSVGITEWEVGGRIK